MEIEWLCVYCLRLRPACDEMMIGTRVSSLFGIDKEVDIFITNNLSALTTIVLRS